MKCAGDPLTVRGRVLRPAHVTREEVRAQPGVLFVFGDNMRRRGLGGQARGMRGENNAVGVPTKWRPDREPEAYFTDADWHNTMVRRAIFGAFGRMRTHLYAGGDVAIPADGLGTGLAELPRRAPIIHRAISELIARLSEDKK